TRVSRDWSSDVCSSDLIFTVDFLGQQNGSGGANDDIMAAMTGIRGADELGWSVTVPSMPVYNTWDERDYRKSVSFADSALVNGRSEERRGGGWTRAGGG